MIPNELLYGLIGVIAALLAGRLGLPIAAPRTPGISLADQVRQTLLDILKGLNEPKPALDEELRRQLRAAAQPQDD